MLENLTLYKVRRPKRHSPGVERHEYLVGLASFVSLHVQQMQLILNGFKHFVEVAQLELFGSHLT